MIDLKDETGFVIKFNCVMFLAFFFFLSLSVIIWETNRSIRQGITRVQGLGETQVSSMNREKRRWIRNVRHSSPRWLFIPCSYLSAMNDRRHAWLKTFPLDRPGCSRRKYRAWILLSLVKSQKVTPRIFRTSWTSFSLSLSRIDCKEISR